MYFKQLFSGDFFVQPTPLTAVVSESFSSLAASAELLGEQSAVPGDS